MQGAKPVDFPMEQRHKLALAEGHELRDVSKYRRLIGRLNYLTITRPELVYYVHILSQFLQAPKTEHWDAALRVVKYVKGSIDRGIVIEKGRGLELTGYSDSDWGSCPTTRRSLTGYFVSLGGSPISWKTKKQVTVSRCTAEAEYRAMAALTSELIWLKTFLTSLGVHHTRPIQLYCDNQAALHIAKNPVFHDRTKHIEIDCHFVRQHLVEGTIATSFVRTTMQLADIFTKALGKDQFRHILGKLGSWDPGLPT
ncbi:hypothetical protein RND81_12G166900 [Saponaria officinalis]|uniref:Uncharacterized protein n=1 Tax=Saponaria officinalis TaxID=3572 RepID=A0AAW1HBJ6_SAPOF